MSEAKERILLSDKPRVRIQSQSGSRAYFDAAATNRLNEKHWTPATGFDIDTLIRGDLDTLRKRARYEISNNGYGSGIADTLAFDIVGTSPWPQIDSGYEDFDQEAEERFIGWSKHCDYMEQMDLAEILQMQSALQQCEAGESVTVLKRDTRVRYDVSLRLLPIATERLDNPLAGSGPTRRLHDGIQFDAEGRPEAYCILKDHPGGSYADRLFDPPDMVPASQVIHLYRIKRPGQSRGIPWFAPALPLFADLRRFTLATIEAAETAANMAGILKNTLDSSTADNESIESNDVIELERNALLTVPVGWEAQQMKPEHPATTYQMFKAEIINEIARGVLMPYNVAAMNSARYNYASGRLDHQKYHRFITCIRSWIARRFLSRVFSAWMMEAYLLDGYFKYRPTWEQALRAVQTIRWQWDGFKHVDPVKEANADQINLDSGSTTLADIYGEKGQDWKRQLRQRGREIALMKELGIPVGTGASKPTDESDDETQDKKDGDDADE